MEIQTDQRQSLSWMPECMGIGWEITKSEEKRKTGDFWQFDV